MPTYSSALLPTTNGLTFGSSALRWTAYLQDMDVAGTPTFTGRVGVKNLEDIRFADQYPGSVSQQINAALADISSGLVVVPTSMATGAFTVISGGKQVLDLRAGGFKLYNNGFSPSFELKEGYVRTALQSLGIPSTTPISSFIAMWYGDNITFRNVSDTADLNLVTFDGSTNQPILGDTSGIQLAGPLKGSGALTGMTTGAFSGKITSTLATGTAPFSITSTTVVPNLNVATLNGVTVSGAPTTGQVLTATGTTTAGWATGGTYKLESAQYTPTTISNSAAATNMMTFTLPANELAVGQAIRLIATGTCANASGGALNFLLRFMLGATSLCATTGAGASIANLTTNGTAAGMWSIEALLICTAVGSSGTLEAQWITGRIGATNFAAAPFNANTATIAINTTTTNVLATNITMSGADPSTTCTQRQMLIERLG